jgi:tripartite-type tricarboxylate transporter receptor subunit TctC
MTNTPLIPAQAGIQAGSSLTGHPIAQGAMGTPARGRAVLRAVFAILLWLAPTMPAVAQDAASFYAGKQIRFIVGSAPGGTYDILARIVARHMAGHIAGHPLIIVQNEPAAGGLVMANQLYALGPDDGTAIGVPINGIPTAPLLEPQVARFDATKLIWIGSTNREPYVAYVWHTAPVQSLAALLTAPLVVGATAPGTTMMDFPKLTNAVLGTKFKIVPGYGSTPQLNQAMERGETEGVGALGLAAVKAQMSPWLAAGTIKLIAQFGIGKSRELPDVPVMIDLAKTQPDRAALAMLFARAEYGRPYFLPPGVPPERVEALRTAFDATMADPAFIADAAKIGLTPDPLTGVAVQALVGRLATTPPAVVARVRAVLDAP